MIRKTRQVAGYHGQPIVFNEDDHSISTNRTTISSLHQRTRVMGLLRLSQERGRAGRRLPERAGELGHQQRAEKRFFRVAK